MTGWRHSNYLVAEDCAGERIDSWLARQPNAPTRSQIKAAADDGRIRIGGKPVRASQRLRGAETVELIEPVSDPSRQAPVGEAIDLDVLFEDEHLLAINKPAGMVVHPAAGNRSGTLVHALLHYDPSIAWPGERERAGIVHRLDRDTSGVILVARTVRAHEALSRQFRDRSIRKTYLALVCAGVRDGGRIDLPIGRHPTERKRMSTTGRPARHAISDYRPLEHLGAFTLLEVRPLTGRTHQIRVHLSARGWPIAGDKVYGGKVVAGLGRQALHAAAIEFEHPAAGGRMLVEAPLASDLTAVLEDLRHPSDGPVRPRKSG